MGCFGSRDSKRQALFGEDFTLVPYGFRKADISNAAAFIPVDALAASYIGAGKDLGESALGEFNKDDHTFAKADVLAEEGKKIFDLLKKVYTGAKDNGDDKETGFNGKYSYKKVSEELNDVLTAVAETDEKLKWPEEEKKAEGGDKPEEAGEKPAADGEGKEGGETQYEGGGGGKLVEVLLAQYLKSEVFADLLKSAVMSTELDSFDPLDFSKMGKGVADLTGLLPKPTDWAACCAIMDIAVQTKEDAKDKELWAKCKLGALDLEELKDAEAGKDKTALGFVLSELLQL